MRCDLCGTRGLLPKGDCVRWQKLGLRLKLRHSGVGLRTVLDLGRLRPQNRLKC